MRILGIHTTSREVYLATVEDDETVDGLTERLQPPAALEAGESLIEFVDSVRRVLREIKPDAIHLLLPETWNATYRQHLDRAMLDTLIRLAAGQEAIPVEVISRPTVRARLGLPKTGALESHLANAGQPIGRYWTTGRGLAALAAKAAGSR